MATPATVRRFADTTFLDILDDAARKLAGKSGRGPMVRELLQAFTDLRSQLGSRAASAASRPTARAAWRHLNGSPAWETFEDFLRGIYEAGGLPYEAGAGAASAFAKLSGIDLGPDDLAKLAGRIARKRAAEFVVGVSRTTRRGMRDLITGAYRLDTQGNREALGRSIRQILLRDPPAALTPHQMKDFERGVKAGRIATQKGIDRLWRKHVFRRARFIAKNEGLALANAAQEAVTRAAVESGEAEIFGFDGVYTSRDGSTWPRPQRHVGCLCGERSRRIDGVIYLEWAARSTSRHRLCLDLDGILKGTGGKTAGTIING